MGDPSAPGHSEDEGRLPVLDAVRRAVVARPGLKSNLSAVKATVEAMMADGWTKLDERAIRASERHRVAALIEEHIDTLAGFAKDDKATIQLVAWLLRLDEA